MPGTGTSVVAVILIVFGIVTVLAGVGLIIVAALTALHVYRQGPRTSGTDYAAGVDWAKILEALSKLPQWMLAIIVGNAQILVGYWLLSATLFGYELWR
jgi:multisubunit Na+/H+ antiporter MnhB subunit